MKNLLSKHMGSKKIFLSFIVISIIIFSIGISADKGSRDAMSDKDIIKNAKGEYVSKYKDVNLILGTEARPGLNMAKWDEASFSMCLAGDQTVDRISKDNNKLKYRYDNYDIDIFWKDYTIGDEQIDALEYEIVLSEKPDKNKWIFNLDMTNLKVYYQPPLNESGVIEEYPEGTPCNATHCGDDYRPENVVGSYAIYHESKKDGKYKTGKFAHIYRPFIKDSAGKWVWGKLEISKNNLIVEVPQEFLDNAEYPVHVDPTFGYNTAGSSYFATYDQYRANREWHQPASGNYTWDKAYVYGEKQGNNLDSKVALYECPADATFNLEGASDEVSIDNSSTQWWEFDVSSLVYMDSDHYYRLVFWMDGDSENGFNLRYDTGEDKYYYKTGKSYTGNFDDPWSDRVLSSSTYRDFSIYGTYSNESSNANESQGDSALDTAISNSELSNPTTYNATKVYIVYDNGTQLQGTFDKVVKESDQRWLLLYKTDSESFTNFSGVGSVINVWENESLTSGQIQSQVETFINQTN